MSSWSYKRLCRICRTLFTAKRTDAELCSAKCRKAASRIEKQAVAFCQANRIPTGPVEHAPLVNEKGTEDAIVPLPLSPLEVQIEVHRFLSNFPLLQGWIVKMLQKQVIRHYCKVKDFPPLQSENGHGKA